MVWTTAVLRQRHSTQRLNRFTLARQREKSWFNPPLQVYKVHQALSPISPMFSIAAAFGNVHGVYKVWQKLLLSQQGCIISICQIQYSPFHSCSPNQAGNVVLSPKLLKGHQDFAKEQLKCSEDKPLYLVMHGGSGSSADEIGEAVSWNWSLSGLFLYTIFFFLGEQWCGEDEHWHRYSMGILGRSEGILQEERRLPSRPGQLKLFPTTKSHLFL